MPIKRSGISYVDFSGGDLGFEIGCTKASEGCDNCFARVIIEDRGGRDFSKVTTYPDKLKRLLKADFTDHGQPFRRGPGSRPIAFPVDMGDLFHNSVPADFILQALWVMECRPDVDWLILTKRAERMALMLSGYAAGRNDQTLPPNIWPGVTAENQKRANERIPLLLGIPASVRWVSVEPMLENVDLETLTVQDHWLDALRGIHRVAGTSPLGPPDVQRLAWVVAGGESDPKRRPFNMSWARSIRDQCKEASVAFYYKQGSSAKSGQDNWLDGQKYQEFPNAG